MKVLLISGSPKANGNTAILIRECAEVIRESGIETEIVSFADMQIQSCRACRKCCETGMCSIDDGLNDIITKLRAAQGMIVGSPVYFGTARGDVMSALQRIGYVSRNSDRFLGGKVGGAVAVARRGGQTFTLQEMLIFFFANDMVVPGSIHSNIAFGRLPGEVLKDEEGMSTARHFAGNVANLLKRLYSPA
jgi:multimeric flavodoxin WrbA